uniref:Uncharacterized protein n=1 Tax=Piliocolobus tephrosceles TaxID=591936 RepID=A0A8C9HC16_9PRIM
MTRAGPPTKSSVEQASPEQQTLVLSGLVFQVDVSRLQLMMMILHLRHCIVARS